MPDYILLMHDDCTRAEDPAAWEGYLEGLKTRRALCGGSAIGAGVSVRKRGPAAAVTGHLNGFVRVTAADIEDARGMVAGNPVYEAGGTVEIRLLPQTD